MYFKKESLIAFDLEIRASLCWSQEVFRGKGWCLGLLGTCQPQGMAFLSSGEIPPHRPFKWLQGKAC